MITTNGFQFERKDDRRNLTVGADLIGRRNIIGPLFFEGNVDADGYLRMINENVVPTLWRVRRFGPNHNGRFQRLWWVQDSTP